MNLEKDRIVLRELASRYAEQASLPVQEEKRRLWKKLNTLEPERPMVMINQICWWEFDDDDKLRILCNDPECRQYEQMLRRALYQWEYFPVDMVLDPFIRVEKAIHNSGFGIYAEKQILTTSEKSEVISQIYTNQLKTADDLEKIKTPVVTHDAEETKRRNELADWLFGGIIETRSAGYDPYVSVWDPISTWMGMEGVMYALSDQPELLHAIADKVTGGYMSMLDQMEQQGLLCQPQSLIHCTGAFTDELPAPGYDPLKPGTQDIWMFGLAQMFSAVSPVMFDIFEIDHSMSLFERFGLVYYGCCDPLHNKMNEVKKIPNLRKVSMSPWTDQEKGAGEIGKSYVFSRKPNPSHLALDVFETGVIEEEFAETLHHCKTYNCPVEFILKDISTVRGRPERLKEWADIAMRCVCR